MNINIKEEDVDQIEVNIICKQVTEQVNKLRNYISLFTERFQTKVDDKIVYIKAHDIYYIESVDNKTFLYCKQNVYEVDYRLYELEVRLNSKDFFRISKSQIININYVSSLKPELNRTILATMNNGERLSISRKYASDIKKILGI